jgi:hypothetical protein
VNVTNQIDVEPGADCDFYTQSLPEYNDFSMKKFVTSSLIFQGLSTVSLFLQIYRRKRNSAQYNNLDLSGTNGSNNNAEIDLNIPSPSDVSSPNPDSDYSCCRCIAGIFFNLFTALLFSLFTVLLLFAKLDTAPLLANCTANTSQLFNFIVIFNFMLISWHVLFIFYYLIRILLRCYCCQRFNTKIGDKIVEIKAKTKSKYEKIHPNNSKAPTNSKNVHNNGNISGINGNDTNVFDSELSGGEVDLEEFFGAEDGEQELYNTNSPPIHHHPQATQPSSSNNDMNNPSAHEIELYNMMKSSNSAGKKKLAHLNTGNSNPAPYLASLSSSSLNHSRTQSIPLIEPPPSTSAENIFAVGAEYFNSDSDVDDLAGVLGSELELTEAEEAQQKDFNFDSVSIM